MFASLNGVADDIDAAYSETIFLGVKLLDPSIVRQLGSRAVKTSPSLFRSPEDSQTPASSISLSSSYPLSGVESSESIDNPGPQEESTASLRLSRRESASDMTPAVDITDWCSTHLGYGPKRG